MGGMWANGTLVPPELSTIATPGACPNDCGNFKFYIALFSFFVFIHSTSEVGSMLLILRCVDPSDKAMALGLIQFAIGLFGKAHLRRISTDGKPKIVLFTKMRGNGTGGNGVVTETVFNITEPLLMNSGPRVPSHYID